MGTVKYIWGRCLVLGLILAAMPVTAAQSFIEGQDYERLTSKVRENPTVTQLIARDPQKVQLLFFFNYGCSACANFDPSFEKWLNTKANDKLVIYRLPVEFEDNWLPLAKLYFVLQQLKPKKDLDAKIFQAIHQQGVDLWEEPTMENFIVENGYGLQNFDTAYNSPDIKAQVKRADTLSHIYAIDRTPTLVINGPNASYLCTVDMVDGDRNKLFQILDYLISLKEKNSP